MASAAQILANQANARHSTGPRTESGKAASSQNATKHGFSSKTLVILPGQEEEFAQLEATLRQQFAPEGGYQNLLFHRILHAAWNQHRCDCAEVELQTASPDASRDPLLAEEFERKVQLLATYAARAERSFLKYVSELRTAQTEARYRMMTGIGKSEASALTDTQAVDRAFDRTQIGKARRQVAESFRNAAPESPVVTEMPGEQTKPSLRNGFRFRDLFER